MQVFTLVGHLLNFCAPAFWLGGAAVLAGRLVLPARGPAWNVRWAVNCAVGIAVLTGGLVVFGHDGRMATWGALVVALATSEWLMHRGWRH